MVSKSGKIFNFARPGSFCYSTTTGHSQIETRPQRAIKNKANEKLSILSQKMRYSDFFH